MFRVLRNWHFARYRQRWENIGAFNRRMSALAYQRRVRLERARAAERAAVARYRDRQYESYWSKRRKKR